MILKIFYELIYYSYFLFGEMPIKIPWPFLILLVKFLALTYKSSPYILDKSFICILLAYFSHSVGCLFTFIIVSFDAQTFSILMNSNLLFSLVACTLDVLSKKTLPNAISHKFIPIFSSKSFILSTLTLMFLTYV